MSLTRKTPMSRGTKGLARTGFRQRSASSEPRPAPDDDRPSRAAARLVACAQAALAAGWARPGVAAAVEGPGKSLDKQCPLRSEAYRRAVAALPCAHCRVPGFSQHAHENEGKGFALKVDDRRGFPLCCDRPGIEGCHVAFDQYRLLPGGREAHRAAGAAWAAQTRATIIKTGRWPARLPQWKGDDDART